MHDIVSKRFLRDARIKSVDVVLHEASMVLRAAQRYASQLAEIGITDSEICRVRKLIAKVAAHHLTFMEYRTDVTSELYELQFAKEVILRTVELRFGSTSDVLKEFCNPEGEKAYVYSHSSS